MQATNDYLLPLLSFLIDLRLISSFNSCTEQTPVNVLTN